MSFWDIVWLIFISWAFVAYVMVMFSILGDIFRDRDVSGVARAVWVLTLVFVPFITALVYLAPGAGTWPSGPCALPRCTGSSRMTTSEGTPARLRRPTRSPRPGLCSTPA
jgi:hypothetical protein